MTQPPAPFTPLLLLQKRTHTMISYPQLTRNPAKRTPSLLPFYLLTLKMNPRDHFLSLQTITTITFPILPSSIQGVPAITPHSHPKSMSQNVMLAPGRNAPISQLHKDATSLFLARSRLNRSEQRGAWSFSSTHQQPSWHCTGIQINLPSSSSHHHYRKARNTSP